MIVILYFLYPSTGTTTFDSTATTFSEIDHIYILAFAFVPAFLLSIRVLANPTKNVFSSPIINYYAHPADKKEFIKSFKKDVISFYAALIMAAIIFFYLKIMQAQLNNQLEEELIKFYPQIDSIALCILIVTYFIILLITTAFGEWFLTKFPPYERL